MTDPTAPEEKVGSGSNFLRNLLIAKLVLIAFIALAVYLLMKYYV